MNALVHHWDVFRKAWVAENSRARSLIGVDDAEFLPAALEIVEKPVSPTARATSWVLLGGLAVTIAWLCLGKVDVVASATGRVIPADNIKLIQPADAGVVRAIHVREGSRVRKGQLLVELDPTVSGADEAQAAKALLAAEIDVARNRALLVALEGRGIDFRPPAGTPAEVAATQRTLITAQLQEIEARVSGLLAARASAEADRATAAQEYQKIDQTLPLLDQQIDAHKQLLTKGYTPKLKVIELERQRLAEAKDRDIAVERQSRAAAEITRTSQAIAEARQEARRTILADLSRAETEAILRREELTKARQKNRLQRLVAPVDGTVQQLAVHTLGGVVEPAKPIMTIVPEDGELIVEAKLLNKDAGFVRAGQPASVKLEAFPFTKYGTLPGTIEQVSSDAVADEKLGLIYNARIRLARSAIAADGRMVPLVPGMAATADIRTGERLIIEYLISPIAGTASEAGRER